MGRPSSKAISPLHLPYTSPTSPLHLPYISPTSPHLHGPAELEGEDLRRRALAAAGRAPEQRGGAPALVAALLVHAPARGMEQGARLG